LTAIVKMLERSRYGRRSERLGIGSLGKTILANHRACELSQRL